ncbi:MAG: NAD(P)/FAD-dependent oxidoreductase [Deltaproteobacteria bacterium]|nr:NAD(P)/FAD-dependent oxidoreductase [Deltaproteobacteria bacterium]
MTNQLPHVVIVGGGFGGLEAAKRLAKQQVRVTLIDRRNHHLFQPLLYQVATGGLSAAEIAMPIRKFMHNHKNVTVWLAEVADIKPAEKQVVCTDGQALAYDYLILATGATHSYFGNDAWANVAPGLKTVEDAFEIRRRVFSAFERAERSTDPQQRQADLTFVIVGGGPTGVELAGTIAEISRNTLVGEFRTVDPKSTRVLLVEGVDRVLPTFSQKLSASAHKQLEAIGVEIKLKTKVTDINENGVTLDGTEQVPSHTVLWAAGVKASGLGAKTGGPLERNGQVKIEPDLSLPGHREVFVVGDLASLTVEGKRVPGVAQGALQMGRHAAQNVIALMAGQATKPFRYNDKGNMATIGRSSAVAQIGKLEFGGFLAWMAWALVHLVSLIGFRNRVVTLVNWTWAYFTFQRSGRLILDRNKPPAANS